MPRLAKDIKTAALWGTIDKYQRIANMNDQALSDRTGIHITTLGNYRSGRTCIRLDALQKIVSTLNIPVDEIARYAL